VLNRHSKKMAQRDTEMLALTNNNHGFTVIPCTDLFEVAKNTILLSIRELLNAPDLRLDEAATVLRTDIYHEKIREKKYRLLKKSLASRVSAKVRTTFDLNIVDFITDEEGLGYENIYWRCVRAGHASDVGSIHADRWFWDINNFAFPKNYERVKVWLPILQNDALPSLLVVPGSHLSDFTYKSLHGKDGKMRPALLNPLNPSNIIHCPVKTGQCVVFNDKLLHGGASTDATRISLEFTLAIQSRMIQRSEVN